MAVLCWRKWVHESRLWGLEKIFGDNASKGKEQNRNRKFNVRWSADDWSISFVFENEQKFLVPVSVSCDARIVSERILWRDVNLKSKERFTIIQAIKVEISTYSQSWDVVEIVDIVINQKSALSPLITRAWNRSSDTFQFDWASNATINCLEVWAMCLGTIW